MLVLRRFLTPVDVYFNVSVKSSFRTADTSLDNCLDSILVELRQFSGFLTVPQTLFGLIYGFIKHFLILDIVLPFDFGQDRFLPVIRHLQFTLDEIGFHILESQCVLTCK